MLRPLNVSLPTLQMAVRDLPHSLEDYHCIGVQVNPGFLDLSQDLCS